MYQYIFKGTIHPIRATLAIGPIRQVLETNLSSNHLSIEFSIYSNQLTVYCDSEDELDIHSLRNLCLNVANGIVGAIGFYSGIGWTVEITEVLNRELGINYVYGADIPCLSSRNDNEKISDFFEKTSKFTGSDGRYLERCFSDLQLAITHPLDTPFYCYRAIESLRHLCRVKYSLDNEDQQWAKLSEISGKSWNDTALTKQYANDARHGDHQDFTSEERQVFLENTWALVENFINEIEV